MQGEPCVDEWPGVTCCLPALDNPNISCNVDGWSQSRVYPLGCSAGTYTGTPVDMAKCVITELKLSANNLVGPLMPSLANLTDLVTVDLRQNDLQVCLFVFSHSSRTHSSGAQFAHTQFHYTQFHHTQFHHTQFHHTQFHHTQFHHTQFPHTQFHHTQFHHTQFDHTQFPHVSQPPLS